MLAQNFKTPADLKVTDAEFDAFLKTLGLLEREEGKLDMARLPCGADSECQTPCCIAGWAGRFLGKSIDLNHRTTALQELFFMRSVGGYWQGVTTSQGAIALRSYLTHGEPRWNEALSG